jgi:predicted nuclease with TOPRIM domain
MLGGSYGYPRREIKSGMVAQPRKWAKAAIFNRGIAAGNPGIKHLRDTHAYEAIRDILEKARQTYVPKNPERRRANLTRELSNLEKEYEIIRTEYPDLRQEYTYTAKSFDEAKKEELDRLMRRINRIVNELGVKPTLKV